MIKSKIFASKGMSYVEEENQLNDFLQAIQTSKGFDFIWDIQVRANSVVVFYETIPNNESNMEVPPDKTVDALINEDTFEVSTVRVEGKSFTYSIE